VRRARTTKQNRRIRRGTAATEHAEQHLLRVGRATDLLVKERELQRGGPDRVA
jgi:hypothetical protein